MVKTAKYQKHLYNIHNINITISGFFCELDLAVDVIMRVCLINEQNKIGNKTKATIPVYICRLTFDRMFLTQME